MKQLVILLSIFLTVKCQQISIDQAINEIFNTSLYEEVTKPPLKDYGPLQKCGENERAGLDICVPYYNCDPTTKTVVEISNDTFNIIDRRFNLDDDQCDHFLDVCCQVPQNTTSTSTTTSTTPSVSVSSTSSTTTTRRSQTTFSTTERTTSTPSTQDNSGNTCGIRNPNGIDFKLSNNKNNEAEYGEFPWQVALLRTKFNKKKHQHQCICGGSLIQPNIVLTATHCVLGFKPNEITVRAGEWDTQTTKERIPHQERVAIRIINHEDYNDTLILNDISLIILDQPFTKVKSVGLICLPDQDEVISSKHCFASGWGKANFGKEGSYSVILKKIELPIVSNRDCENSLRRTRLGKYFKLHESFICAGGGRGKDTCTGDGGSPLVCPDPKNPGRYVQTGIVSWGIGCGIEGIPGVYADVSKFRRWIDNKLQEL